MNLARTVALLSLIGLTGCATSPTGRSQFMMVPDSQVQQMGAQAFANLKQETPTERNASANRYIDCVAGAITREVGGSWEVVLFKDDSPNAFALPGGKIGVHTGLLKVAQNQHQLATVLGHEVAHVLAKHSNERVSQQMAVSSGLQLIGAVAQPTTALGQQMMGLLGVGAQYGILMPYGRIQESEADQLGLDLMARAGFDPRESIDLWVNMGRAGGGQPPEFLSTHPSHGTRINDLKGYLPRALSLQQQAQSQGKSPRCG